MAQRRAGQRRRPGTAASWPASWPSRPATRSWSASASTSARARDELPSGQATSLLAGRRAPIRTGRRSWSRCCASSSTGTSAGPADRSPATRRVRPAGRVPALLRDHRPDVRVELPGGSRADRPGQRRGQRRPPAGAARPTACTRSAPATSCTSADRRSPAAGATRSGRFLPVSRGCPRCRASMGVWPAAAGLTEGEHLVLRLHQHWKTVLRPVLILAATVVALLVLLLLVPAVTRLGGGPACPRRGRAGRSSLAGSRVPLLRWRTTSYELTNRRLRLRAGILTRTGRDFPLSKISDVSFAQGAARSRARLRPPRRGVARRARPARAHRDPARPGRAGDPVPAGRGRAGPDRLRVAAREQRQSAAWLA